MLSRALLSGGRRFSTTPRVVSQLQMDEGAFEDLAEAYLASIDNALDKLASRLNPEEIAYSYGVLTIDLGKKGTWVLNKQTPNQQIWWSSPVSGPRRFFFSSETGKWHWTRDTEVTINHSLGQELKDASGVPVKLD